MPFPLDRRFVERVEAELGARLPRTYVSKMMAENGGEVLAGDDDWQLFPIFDDTDRKRIQRTCNHVLRETQSARGWRGFPPNAVAIGGNGGGDVLLFLIDCDRGECGNDVYVFDHEAGSLEKVAHDFGELGDD